MKIINGHNKRRPFSELAKTLAVRSLTLTLVTLLGHCVQAQTDQHRRSGHQPEKGADRLQALQAERRAALALPCRRNIPLLNALGAAGDSLPVTTKLVTTTRAGQQVRVAVHQRGAGVNDSVIVLIHGALADHRSWCYLAGPLGSDHDLCLIDLPGCGDSDKPNPAEIEPDGYSPSALAERVLQVLDQSFGAFPNRRAQPKRVTLVGHSLGGTICLRMFSEPELRARYQGVLDQIDGMVLLAPCDVAVHAEIPKFVNVINLKGWIVDVGEGLGVFQEKVAKATRDAYHLPECATAEGAAMLREILIDPARRRSAQAMLKQAVPWRIKEHRPDWPAIQRLATGYANVNAPCLIVWGEWDETLPASMGHKIRDEVPTARLITIEGCGHSLPTEKPVECAEIIRHFVADLDAGNVSSYPPVARFGQSRAESTQVLSSIPIKGN